MKRILNILLLAVWAGSCGCDRKDFAVSVPEKPAVSVRTAVITVSTNTSVIEVVGTVHPRVRAVIEAKTSGRVERIPIALGQSVRKGDLLAEIDLQEIKARVDRASAQKKKAVADLQRATTLLAEAAITQAEFDAIQSQFQVADAELREVKTTLGYSQVAAPFDGTIVRKLVEAGDQALPGRPLIEMEDPHSLRFRAEVPENIIHRVHPGQNCMVSIPAIGKQVRGKLVELSPMAHDASRTFQAELDMEQDESIRSGMFGRLQVPGEDQLLITAPTNSVIIRGQLETVFVMENNRAQLRLVKTGRLFANQVEILSGLSGGEILVLEPSSDLSDGHPVQPKP